MRRVVLVTKQELVEYPIRDVVVNGKAFRIGNEPDIRKVLCFHCDHCMALDNFLEDDSPLDDSITLVICMYCSEIMFI